jgi:hypothetical protein
MADWRFSDPDFCITPKVFTPSKPGGEQSLAPLNQIDRMAQVDMPDGRHVVAGRTKTGEVFGVVTTERNGEISGWQLNRDGTVVPADGSTVAPQGAKPDAKDLKSSFSQMLDRCPPKSPSRSGAPKIGFLS